MLASAFASWHMAFGSITVALHHRIDPLIFSDQLEKEGPLLSAVNALQDSQMSYKYGI